MKLIKLLGIAPYEELNRSMTTISKSIENVNIDIFTANLETGQKIVEKSLDRSYDAIISRGGTADLIRSIVSIPVIDVSISIYDVLGAIQLANNYTNNFAIVGYPSITETAHLLCDILQYKIKILTLTEDFSAAQALAQLKKENCQLVLCDAVTNQTAISMSLTTILITSGYESIRHAFEQAITTVKHIRKAETIGNVLTSCFQKQNHSTIILNSDFSIFQSNLPDSLTLSIQGYLKNKLKNDNKNKYYHSYKNQIFQLSVQQIQSDISTVWLCEVKETTPPLIHGQLPIQYLGFEEVKHYLDQNLFSTIYIPEKTKIQLSTLAKQYNATLIFGEEGTTKQSIAYSSYIVQESHTNNLITINCRLLTEKTWKFLVNPNNGPLVDSGNTILFQDLEYMSASDIEQLIAIITHSKFLQRNNLLFTYSTNIADENNTIFNRVVTQINCCSIMSSPVRDRKNELPSIISQLINKINIEHSTDIIGFSPAALNELIEYDWPGNLRQLENLIRNLVLQTNSHYISEHLVIEALEKERLSNANQTPFSNKNEWYTKNKTLFEYNKDIILEVLEKNQGNQTKTASELGISRTTLWRYLKD
ncbi:TPA: PrpR N-terminal domain-containing protein [Streptococcus suis]